MHSAHKERAAAPDNAAPRRSPTFGIQERPPSCPQRKERSGQRQQGSGRSLTQPRSSIPAIREAEARAPDAAAIRQIGRNGHLVPNPAPIAMRQRRTEISNVPGAAQPGTTQTPALKAPVSSRPSPDLTDPIPKQKPSSSGIQPWRQERKPGKAASAGAAGPTGSPSGPTRSRNLLGLGCGISTVPDTQRPNLFSPLAGACHKPRRAAA
jgi:hypothetical protein